MAIGGKKIYILMATSIFILFLSFAAFAAEESLTKDAIGEVTYLTGMVRATQPDGTTRELDLSSPVFSLDVLTTSLKSSVEVRFKDETVFAQGPESSISLDEFIYSTDTSTANLLFKMGEGTFRFVTGEIVKQNPDGFNLETPLATIGIRGTEVFSVNGKKKETIGVTKIGAGHVVDVKSPKGSASMSKPGLSVGVGPDGSLSTPSPTSPGVRKKVMRDAPMPSQGERGAAGDQADLKRKVKAFKQTLSHQKGGLGGLGGKPNYGNLHKINIQKAGQKNAENERDGKASESANQMNQEGSSGGSNNNKHGGGTGPEQDD